MTNEEKIEKMLKFFHGSRTLKDLLLEMAEWKEQQTIGRAVEWLKKNAGTYHRFDVNENRFFYNYNAMIDAFQQAMEE